MQNIIEMVERLPEMETGDLSPKVEDTMTLREDVVEPSLPRDEVLKNEAGQILGRFAKDLVGTDDQIAIVSHVKGVSTAVEREKGFRGGSDRGYLCTHCKGRKRHWRFHYRHSGGSNENGPSGG